MTRHFSRGSGGGIRASGAQIAGISNPHILATRTAMLTPNG
jgi:hypothetical protein